MARGRRITWLGLLATLLPAGAWAQDAPTPSVDAAPAALALADPPRLFDEVWRTVEQRFFDRTHRGKDWAAIREAWLPAACEAPTPRRLREVINGMLGELRVSHLSLVDPDVYRAHFVPELTNRPAPQLGVEWVALPEGIFAAGLWEGAPAVRAGVRRGDRLVAIDGIAAARHPALLPAGSDPGLASPPGLFLLPCPEDQEMCLVLERRPGQHVEAWVRPEPGNMVTASRRSVRVFLHAGRRVGYVHFWHFLAGEMATILRDALAGPFAECDSLVIDVRGRGGSPVVMDRILRGVTHGRENAPWRDAVVCCIDEGSRSAKEIFAWKWRKAGLGPLVGRRTEGAVIASTFFPMHDGSMLLMGVRDVADMSGGEQLEGVGVAPDIDVPGTLPFADGRDEILARALDVAAERAKAGPRRAKPASLPTPRRRAA